MILPHYMSTYDLLIRYFACPEMLHAINMDGQDISKPMLDEIVGDVMATKKHETPTVNVTESESIGFNLNEMNGEHVMDNPSKRPTLGDFILPVKPASQNGAKKQEKKNEKQKLKEVPSLADINLLHKRRKEAVQKNKTNAEIENKVDKTNGTLDKTKQGEAGSLGDETHSQSSDADLRSKIGDVGSLGDSNSKTMATKKDERDWKRMFGNLDNLTEQPKNPEYPSMSDIGELNTFKKEMYAAVKGLGPDATFMIKKSRVPKPKKFYWGINALGNSDDGAAESPTQRRYWGVNVANAANEEKDTIPGMEFFA